MNNRVSIIRCSNYDSDSVYKAMREAIDLAQDFDVKGLKVLLKPNILFDADVNKALTTHPEVLKAAIRICKEEGAEEIFVGDSPGVQKPTFSGKKCGLRQVTEEADVTWVDFTKETVILPCPDGKVSRQFTVSSIVNHVDRIISLPKLKTHQLMYFTGAMKNLFGLIPNLLKSPYHLRHPSREGFASMIVDLNTALKPHYAIMDGIVGMEGPGPANGYPRQIGLILASSNLLAIDVIASGIISYPIKEIPITIEALNRKIWLTSTDQIETLGEDPAKLVIRDYKKIPIKKSTNQLAEFASRGLVNKIRTSFEPRPVFIKHPCVKCGDCIKICPAKALEFHGRGNSLHVAIDYTACIRCFCCHEMCPVDAIAIKRAPFRRSDK